MTREPTAVDALAALVQGLLHPPPILARTEIAGLTVSTVETPDYGCETAMIDAQGTHPVERYPTPDAAQAGHARWVAQAPTLLTIRKLGYGTLVAPRSIRLIRRP